MISHFTFYVSIFHVWTKMGFTILASMVLPVIYMTISCRISTHSKLNNAFIHPSSTESTTKTPILKSREKHLKNEPRTLEIFLFPSFCILVTEMFYFTVSFNFWFLVIDIYIRLLKNSFFHIIMHHFKNFPCED